MLLILLTSVLLPAQVIVNTYDFESHTIGAIHGQDNWLYMGNLNNSGNSASSGNCSYAVAAVPSAIAATPTVGLYTGGKGLYNGGTTGNSHGFASRKNNAAWGYSVTPGTDYLVLEFDYDNGNYWGELVNLGYDKNGDGDYSSNCRTADANEISLGLNISTSMLFFRADGSTVSAPRVGSGWARYRITVDLRANGGQGAAYVCYRELASSGAWQQVPGLQNINMNINPASLNQDNLQNLDGIIVQQEAGGAGTVDNISITTYENTNLVPVSLCAGNTLSLPGLSIPSVAVYQWNTPAGNTFTTSVAGFTLNNVSAADHGTYTLSVNDCTPLTWTVPVTVNQRPVMTSAGSATICSGGDPNITFTSAPGASYSWLASDNVNTTGESLSTQTLAVLHNTIISSSALAEIVTYSVTPSSLAGSCVGTTQTISVRVEPSQVPTVSIAASNSSVCAGSVMNFTATPTNGGTSPAYQWQVNGANAGTGAVFTSTTLANHQTVSVILTSNAVCALPLTSNSNTITSVVIPTVAPSVSIAASSPSICAGSSLSFTATPTNGGASPAYQWLVNGANAGTGSVYTSTTLANTDLVSVTLSSNATCVVPSTVNSNAVTAVVIPTVVPTVSVAVSSQSICAGSVMSFTATPTNGGASPAYQWLVNGTNAGTGSLFSITTLTNNQTISVRLTSNATCALPSVANSNTITAVVIQTVVPTVSVAASSQSICAGSSMSFTAIPTNGGASPAYQWLVNGAAAGTGSVLTSAALTNNQPVSVILTSNAVCALPSTTRSNTITAVVISTVVSTVSVAVSSQSICTGASMSFTATPTNGGASPAYQWLVNGTNAGTGSVFASTTLVNNQTVSVILTSNALCALPSTANSNTITAVVIPTVVPTVSVAASTQSICAGSSLSFTATPTNGGTLPAYQWLVNGANAGNGSVFSSATLANNDAVSVALTSNATCALPSGARSNTISAVVIPTVIPTVTVAASSPSICAGSSMSFTATPTNGGTSPAYQWLVNSVNAGTGSVFSSTTLSNNQSVSLVLTSNAVCVLPSSAVSNTITAVVIPTVVPAVLIAASGSSLCAGSALSFTATPTNGGASPGYQWLVNGAPAGTGSVFSSTALANNDAVSVALISDAACALPAGAISNTITAVVIPTVAPSVSIAASAYSICAGSSISFTATPGNGGTSPTYQWFVNGNAAGSGLVFSPVNLKDRDALSVELSSDAVCAVPASITSAPLVLSVTPLPVASFQYSPDPLTDIDPAINFQNNSLNATSWSWDFGSGAISDEQHPVYTYPRAGTYAVTLVARNAQCRGVSTKTITVEAVTTYYIPDAFTPNGDGVNDSFGLVGFGLRPDTYEMSIYNRWGDLIFRSSPDTPLWDGNRGSERAEAGVYVYMISFEYKQGAYKEFVNKTGHLTLIR